MSATKKFRCIGLGEILWDLLPAGRQLGGAPANFAYHAHALGAEGLVLSRVGDDELGRAIVAHLQAVGLRTDGLSMDATAPTGTVTVALDPQGKPAFTIHEQVAWDELTASGLTLAEAAYADAICFGTLGQRSPAARAAIRAILDAAPPMALRIFDINLRQHFWSPEVIVESLERADVLKLNDEELPVVAGVLGITGEEPDVLEQVARRFSLTAVALTKGANGSTLLVHGMQVTHPGSKIVVADTVGAGDSYTAALALGLLHGNPPARIIQRAHRLADYVCTQHGAMPPLPPALVADIARF